MTATAMRKMEDPDAAPMPAADLEAQTWPVALSQAANTANEIPCPQADHHQEAATCIGLEEAKASRPRAETEEQAN